MQYDGCGNSSARVNASAIKIVIMTFIARDYDVLTYRNVIKSLCDDIIRIAKTFRSVFDHKLSFISATRQIVFL